MAILDLLLLHGANPHALDRQGNSAAHYAAASGSLTALQYLITDCQVDAQGRNAQGQTPYDCAWEYQRSDVVAWLSHHCASSSVNSTTTTSSGIAVTSHSENKAIPGAWSSAMDTTTTPTIRDGSRALQ